MDFLSGWDCVTLLPADIWVEHLKSEWWSIWASEKGAAVSPGMAALRMEPPRSYLLSRAVGVAVGFQVEILTASSSGSVRRSGISMYVWVWRCVRGSHCVLLGQWLLGLLTLKIVSQSAGIISSQPLSDGCLPVALIYPQGSPCFFLSLTQDFIGLLGHPYVTASLHCFCLSPPPPGLSLLPSVLGP